MHYILSLEVFDEIYQLSEEDLYYVFWQFAAAFFDNVVEGTFWAVLENKVKALRVFEGTKKVYDIKMLSMH